MSRQRLIRAPKAWDDLRAEFVWPDMGEFNIAAACIGHWAETEPERAALIVPRDEGGSKTYAFGELNRLVDKLAVVFTASGIGVGDRVAVLLGQSVETLLVHMAAYRIGAIVVPLFTAFGRDGLRYRIADSGARLLVSDAENLPKVLAIRDDLPDLEHVFSVDYEATLGGDGAPRDFWAAVTAVRGRPAAVVTGPDTPALLVYTSGTTGPPKGALHGHRVLMGHLPGVETHHDFLPQDGDCLWTPADWAWMGGLMNVLLPGLCHGVPVVAHRPAKFEADKAVAMMREIGVRNVFFPPTALKLLRQLDGPLGLNLRSAASGGEALGAELLEWGRTALGVTINEFYGSTECNLVLGNSATVMAPRPGSTGRAVPGSEVAVIDPDTGLERPRGEAGEIAVRRGDPAMFLGYWNQPEKTEAKFVGDWMLTGDEGMMDADGFVFFAARTDDVITSSGYRIGPFEIEECLMGHPAVVQAVAVGEPDPDRGEVVKAYVVLRAGDTIAALKDELIGRVRKLISAHVAPRDIEAVDEIPLTATGKILRRALRKG